MADVDLDARIRARLTLLEDASCHPHLGCDLRGHTEQIEGMRAALLAILDKHEPVHTGPHAAPSRSAARRCRPTGARTAATWRPATRSARSRKHSTWRWNVTKRRWPTCMACGSPLPDGAPGTPVHRALLPISEPARRIHRCDERCVCPADDRPLAYAPAHGLHACQDPDCRYAHPATDGAHA